MSNNNNITIKRKSKLCLDAPLVNSSIAKDFCVGIIPIQVVEARTIISNNQNAFLVLDRALESIILYTKKDNITSGGGSSAKPNNWITRPLIRQTGLNHGFTLYKNYIYASSDNTVYRWSYINKDFLRIGQIEEVITNMNNNGNDNGTDDVTGSHRTRTLKFDNIGRLYVSVGSVQNIDTNSFRSRIRRFNVSNTSLFPINFTSGEVYADGLRNTCGMAFDSNQTLWGVDNGSDDLYRQDLGGDISNDNPAEELNQFSNKQSGSLHYGYPYCFTEYNIPIYGKGIGTQWSTPILINSSDSSSLNINNITDEQCRNESLYIKPTLSMQGHMAPLDITFYQYPLTNVSSTICNNIIPFPKYMDGNAFITFHGSWNRNTSVGYKVSYVPIPLLNNSKNNNIIDLLKFNSNTTAEWDNGFRPVSLSFDECGRLLVSSDGTKIRNNDGTTTTTIGSNVIRIEYTIEIIPRTNRPSKMPSHRPSSRPSYKPSLTKPTARSPSLLSRTRRPTTKPSSMPSLIPSFKPSTKPIRIPSSVLQPRTAMPAKVPTVTSVPIKSPSYLFQPSTMPTFMNSQSPSTTDNKVCTDAMSKSDLNDNDYIDPNEYVQVVNIMNGDSNNNTLTSFDSLPPIIQTAYATYATNTTIGISISNDDEMQRQQLRISCNGITLAIEIANQNNDFDDDVMTLNTPGPSTTRSPTTFRGGLLLPTSMPSFQPTFIPSVIVSDYNSDNTTTIIPTRIVSDYASDLTTTIMPSDIVSDYESDYSTSNIPSSSLTISSSVQPSLTPSTFPQIISPPIVTTPSPAAINPSPTSDAININRHLVIRNLFLHSHDSHHHYDQCEFSSIYFLLLLLVVTTMMSHKWLP